MKPKKVKVAGDEEQKQLDKITENTIDYYIEQERLSQVPHITEGTGEEY